MGALTLGGFLKEVCRDNRDKEALVFHAPSGAVIRRSYAQVWQEACAVARALIARGVTKETRVGLLATNRPEWITGMFGIALAGGTCVALSTFAKGAELENQLRTGDVAVLIFERSVIGRDFAAELVEICPDLAHTQREVRSTILPFLRRAVCIGEPAGGAFELWSDFLADDLAPASLLRAHRGRGCADGPRARVFLLGHDREAEGDRARPSRRGAAMLAMASDLCVGFERADVEREWLFLVGQFCHGARLDARGGRLPGAAAAFRYR